MIQRSVVASSRKAVIALSILGVFSTPAMAEVSALVGGDTVSGDQATVALDVNVPQAFTYTRATAGNSVATAYFDRHLFCAETPKTATQIVLNPRYQLPPTVGADVWKFPQLFVQDLAYEGTGTQQQGAMGLRIGSSNAAGQPRYRCLSAAPRSSLDPWNASHGLFSTNFGDYGASNGAMSLDVLPPAGPHQNLKITAQVFPGFADKSVSVVKVAMQLDATNPSQTSVVVVDAYNSAALSPTSTADSDKATWCLLTPSWVEGTTPPASLCDDASILFPGTIKESGAFVKRSMGFQAAATGPWYVLVSRQLNGAGAATAGTPIQGFAALRIGGGLVGVPEESQDWYPDDSVWYNY